MLPMNDTPISTMTSVRVIERQGRRQSLPPIGPGADFPGCRKVIGKFLRAMY